MTKKKHVLYEHDRIVKHNGLKKYKTRNIEQGTGCNNGICALGISSDTLQVKLQILIIGSALIINPIPLLLTTGANLKDAETG